MNHKVYKCNTGTEMYYQEKTYTLFTTLNFLEYLTKFLEKVTYIFCMNASIL